MSSNQNPEDAAHPLAALGFLGSIISGIVVLVGVVFREPGMPLPPYVGLATKAIVICVIICAVGVFLKNK